MVTVPIYYNFASCILDMASAEYRRLADPGLWKGWIEGQPLEVLSDRHLYNQPGVDCLPIGPGVKTLSVAALLEVNFLQNPSFQSLWFGTPSKKELIANAIARPLVCCVTGCDGWD